ncbi:MAG TPA: hypothetical protein VI731_03515 [Bacteroidia bacterium]|nr:hypothetical protein [Bacteroidia bacterium]
MLSFNSKGHLKPSGLIHSTIDEMKEILVDGFDSETRLVHFQNFLKYSHELKQLLGGMKLTQWIDGSFVTKKLNPKDIDLVTFVKHNLIKKTGQKLAPFKAGKSWETFGVDAYIIEIHPEGSKTQMFTDLDKAYWNNQFLMSVRNRKGERFQKGFLEIIH